MGASILERVRALPDRVPRQGVLGQILGVVILAGIVAVTPAGDFLGSHVGRQIREVLLVARSRPSSEDLRTAVLGKDYAFMSFVREHTDEDAIILMSDQFARSELEPLKGKSQHWATFFLYPRRVLYLHQDEIPWYREASWLILDGTEAVSWIDPAHRPAYAPGELRLSKIQMGQYLDLLAAGEIDRKWTPPFEPSRTPKSGR